MCTISGNPEVYGLGIRVSFYLLWFSLTLSRWISSPELFLVVLGTHFVLATAVFFGLVITVANAGTLSAAEVYVTILLISALTCYERVPYCIWRMATAFRAELDNRVYYFHHGLMGRENMPGPSTFVVTEASLLACVFGLQLWFFISGVESEALYDPKATPWGGGCKIKEQFGFLFTPSDLRSPGFRALHIILVLAVVLGSIVVSLADRGIIVPKSRRRRRTRRPTYLRLCLFKQMQTLVDLAVIPIIIGAVEVTIIWNNIPNVNEATTSSQLIPILISVTLLAMVICQLFIGLSESTPSVYTASTTTSSSNTTEHIYSAIQPAPCPCGGPGYYEKYLNSPLAPPPVTHMTGGNWPHPRTQIPPAPTVVSTSNTSDSSSSESARTDKATSGASSRPSSKGPSKKSSVDEKGGKGESGSGSATPARGESSRGPKGPRPMSAEDGS